MSVFDVSQTEELPDIIVDELKGSVENYEAFFAALRQESPVPISFEDIPGGAKGFFSPVESRIAIQEGMSEIQTVKTAIHKIAHAKLHAVKPDEKPHPKTRRIVTPKRLRRKVWPTRSASVTALRPRTTLSAKSPVGHPVRKPRS